MYELNDEQFLKCRIACERPMRGLGRMEWRLSPSLQPHDRFLIPHNEQNKMQTNWLKFNSGLIVKNSNSLNDDSFVKSKFERIRGCCLGIEVLNTKCTSLVSILFVKVKKKAKKKNCITNFDITKFDITKTEFSAQEVRYLVRLEISFTLGGFVLSPSESVFVTQRGTEHGELCEIRKSSFEKSIKGKFLHSSAKTSEVVKLLGHSVFMEWLHEWTGFMFGHKIGYIWFSIQLTCLTCLETGIYEKMDIEIGCDVLNSRYPTIPKNC
ncbi:hypothetical protein BpHYR1_037343 [Brachionus plicatilis]|uniref:Uncharacterized protein n=1 Tax=Brachionus plicatilis TaxID=10195 RepID=A0A3M7PKK0_BRAPC|nr:hypothetical protein BpHYR1_037343 [Brachionus plicatilis]